MSQVSLKRMTRVLAAAHAGLIMASALWYAHEMREMSSPRTRRLLWPLAIFVLSVVVLVLALFESGEALLWCYSWMARLRFSYNRSVQGPPRFFVIEIYFCLGVWRFGLSDSLRSTGIIVNVVQFIINDERHIGRPRVQVI